MRTHGEVVQFVKQCVKIEQKGGDVLGYIAKNWPSYTPRATWYNLQRGYLNRKTNELTEGKPKVKIERKEEEPMKKREDTELLAKAVIQCYQTGGDVRKLLLDRGYKDASAELSNLKFQFKRKDPELYLELKEIRLQRVSTRKAKKPVPEPAKAEVGGTLGEPDEGAEVVKHNGKEYVKMEAPSPTCCQPAPESGVTVPDELPEEPDGNQRVAAVAREMLEEIKTAKDAKPIYPIGEEEMVFSVKKMDSRLGTWEYNQQKDQYIFAANKFDDQLNVLALDIKDWLNLAAEIPKAIRKLTEIME